MKLIRVDQEGRLPQIFWVIKMSLLRVTSLCSFVAVMLFFSVVALAVPTPGPPPQTFTLDGQLFADTAMTLPLLDSSVLVDIKIFDSPGTCLIYQESQVINTASTGGYFNIKVGSETLTGGKRVSMNDPGNPMPALFQNLVPVFQSPTFCSPSYVPTAFAPRILRMTISTSAGITETFADMSMDAVPNAFVAETIQGLGPANIVQTDSASLTQANVANIFSTTNYAQLVMLLAGSSNQYVARASDGTASLPSLSSNPTGASAGQIWFDSSGSAVKYYDGTTVRTLGTSGGSVSSVASGAGLTGGPITSTGTVSIASAGVVSSMLGSGAVTSSKLDPAISISTTGTVMAASGTFGGVATNLINLYASGSTSQFVRLSAAAGASYPVILPATAGSAGSVLATDGSGNLSWAVGGAGGSSQWINNASSIYYGSGNVGIGSTTPLNKLDVAGSLGVSNMVYIGGSGFANVNIINGGLVYQNGGDPFTRLQSVGNGNSRIELQSNASSGAALDANHESGRIDIGGYNGSSWPARTASIAGLSEAGWTPAYTPMALTFLTNNSTTFSEKMRITGSGNVGIGTNNPGAPLELYTSTTTANTQIETLRISSNNFGLGAGPYIKFRDAVVSDLARIAGIDSVNYGGSLGFYTKYGDNVGGNPSIERMRIDSNGNVGIGTITPQAFLDVNGSGTSQSAMLVPRDSTAARPTGINGMLRYNTDLAKLEGYMAGTWTSLAGSGGTSSSSQWVNGASGVISYSSGNVAIGTTSAPNLLTIGSNGGLQTVPNVIQLNNSGYDNPSANGAASNGDKFVMWNEAAVHNIKNAIGNDPYGVWIQASGDGSSHFTIWTGPTAAAPVERMRIDANGKFGIGTTGPAERFDVEGGNTQLDVGGGGSGSGYLRLYPGNPAYLSGYLINPFGSTVLTTNARYISGNPVYDAFGIASQVRLAGGQINFEVTPTIGSAGNPISYISAMAITSSGNVGIGTTSPGAILDINGSGTTQSAMIVPRDSTGNRPTSAVNGMIRYNTSLAQLEAYVGGGWASLSTGAVGGGSTQWQNGSSSSIYYSSGNVGVGTANPTNTFEVQGGTAASGNGTNILLTAQNSAFGAGTNVGGNIILQPGGGIAATGGVGIGTASPTNFFEVQGGIAPSNKNGLGILLVAQSGSNTGSAAGNITLTGAAGTATAAGGSVFLNGGGGGSSGGTGGNIILTPGAGNGAANGKVGIGTSSPAVTLDVNGGVRAGNSTAVTICNGTTEGTQRYNYSGHNMEYCNGTGWQPLATSGTSPMVLISTQTASSSGSLSWTNLTANNYRLTCYNLIASTATSLNMQFGEGSGPTWETAGYTWARYAAGACAGCSGSAGTTADIGMTINDLFSTNSFGSDSVVSIYGLSVVGSNKKITGEAAAFESTASTSFTNRTFSGIYTADTNAITALRIIPASGTIASGTCSLYSIAN